MKKYIVDVIAVSGMGKKIHKYGEEVSEANFPAGHAEKLHKGGYLKLSKNAKKDQEVILKKNVKDAKSILIEKRNAHADLLAAFGKLDKPVNTLVEMQQLIDGAQTVSNEATDNVQGQVTEIAKLEVALKKVEADEVKANAATEKLDVAKKELEALQVKANAATENIQKTTDNLTEAQNNLKLYTESQRKVNDALSVVQVAEAGFNKAELALKSLKK